MITKIREEFNDNFQQSYYDALQAEVLKTFGEPCAFRISESPVFIDKDMKKKVYDACEAILEQLDHLDYEAIRQRFMPKALHSPTHVGNPHFLGIDFGLCVDEKGNLSPQLIELQAFPSLFFYQAFLGEAYLRNYPIIPKAGYHYYLGGHDKESYFQELKKVILGDTPPEHVILMEIFPEKQKTRIDFWATRQALGIEVVCMTKVIREGRKLFYEKEGKKIAIHRIYNRVIFDDLAQIPDLKTNFNLFDAVDVTWVTNPDWFFMISKCIMPLLSHESIPDSYYLDEIPSDLDLKGYVLKPLFSFAGKGIHLEPTWELIEAISDRKNYMLQKKVEYASLIKTNTEKNAKVELRILYLWNDEAGRLKPVINLTRMGKGGLINVSHLTDDSWIGSSISFFED
jgi:glutathionylspermidine synthase